MSCFLKNHSDAGKKSNIWDKENVWALKYYTTNLLYEKELVVRQMKHRTIYLVFGLIAKLTLNCGLQVKKYDFPNLQKLASIRGEIGENTPNT